MLLRVLSSHEWGAIAGHEPYSVRTAQVAAELARSPSGRRRDDHDDTLLLNA